MQHRLWAVSCLLFFVSSFLLINLVNASSCMWNQTYGGEATDFVRSLIQTSDGGYAMAGWTESYGAGGTDYWLVKTDSQGNTQWSQTYGGTGSENAHAVVQTTDEGYALTGYRQLKSDMERTCWLVKTDSEGNMNWNQTFSGSENYLAYSLVETSDGGLIIAGTSFSSDVGNYDLWIIKTDATGEQQWNKTFGGNGFEEASSVIETSDENFVITGYTTSFGSGNYDGWLIKTDSDGNMQWNQTYGGANWDELCSVVQTIDRGYAMCGMTASYNGTSNDFWLVKTDADGNMVWNQTYDAGYYEKAHAIVETSDGGLGIAGYISYSTFKNDFWLIKTDSTGNIQWNQTYGTEKDWDIAYSLIQTADGGYALVGETLSTDDKVDWWLIKTDGQGIIPET
ncbi:MAG: hypothetical protein ACOWW1_09690 [archaeon]